MNNWIVMKHFMSPVLTLLNIMKAGLYSTIIYTFKALYLAYKSLSLLHSTKLTGMQIFSPGSIIVDLKMSVSSQAWLVLKSQRDQVCFHFLSFLKSDRLITRGHNELVTLWLKFTATLNVVVITKNTRKQIGPMSAENTENNHMTSVAFGTVIMQAYRQCLPQDFRLLLSSTRKSVS